MKPARNFLRRVAKHQIKIKRIVPHLFGPILYRSYLAISFRVGCVLVEPEIGDELGVQNARNF